MNPSAPPTAIALRAAALLAATALLTLLQLSCAASNQTAVNNPMPAARAGLRPEYRVFYDEMKDYGDWVLIEPYGFVFRPRTRFNEWSPYFDGFWSPSDSYGWIWVSGEPFGWATYHYGAWINDDFQNWVWVPGLEWAPAWVAWAGNQNYVGWAALTPSGNPNNHFNVVPRAELGAPDVRSRVLPPEKAAAAIKNAEPIENYAQVERVLVNLGPRIEWIEQVSGPLPRARIEDVPLRRGFGRNITPGVAVDQKASAPAAPQSFRQVTESAAAQARTIMQQKQPAPVIIPRIRVTDVAPLPTAPGTKPGFRPARADSAH